MRHATIVPLIGGNSIAGKKITGVDPEFFLSYKPFAENEKNVKAYFPNVPHYLLDDPNQGGFDENQHQGMDFVQALCPCAGLSLLSAGSEEQRDGMNSWMINSAKFITGKLKPKVFFGENAPALYSNSGARVRSQFREIARENGYSFSIYCTNTMFHGVPQSRKRTFYFFWKDSTVPIFNYYKRPRKNLRDYLAEITPGMPDHSLEDIEKATRHLQDNPYIQFIQSKYSGNGVQRMRDFMKEKGMHGYTMHRYFILTGQLVEARDWLAANGFERNAKEATRIIDKLNTSGGFWDGSFPIYDGEGTFATLISRTLHAIHPVEDRVLTLRECMHMMALPHDFKLVNGQLNNICQNVPVCTAADMVTEVVGFLNGERTMTNSTYVLQSNLNERIDVQESSLLGY